jgi:hypothetical protein
MQKNRELSQLKSLLIDHALQLREKITVLRTAGAAPAQLDPLDFATEETYLAALPNTEFACA